MNYYIILAALSVTAILTLGLSVLGKKPLKSLGMFFLFIFLSSWAGQLWIRPYGPKYFGVALVPMIIVSVFLTLFMLAYPSPIPQGKDMPEDAIIASNAFFWVSLVLLLFIIALGHAPSFGLAQVK